MKVTFVIFGLVALVGASMAMSLLDHEMAKLRARAMKGGKGQQGEGQGGAMEGGQGGSQAGGQRKGQGKGKGKGQDKMGEERAFSAMLAFSALGGKCEVLGYYIDMVMDSSNMTFDEVAVGVGMAAPTLASACPKIAEFSEQYMNGTEDSQEAMMKCMAPYGVLLQCTNLFAEIDTMRLIGFTNSSDDGTPESQLMVHGQPLFDACMEIFGDAEQAEESVENDLDEVEDAGLQATETRELKALLKELQSMIVRK